VGLIYLGGGRRWDAGADGRRWDAGADGRRWDAGADGAGLQACVPYCAE